MDETKGAHAPFGDVEQALSSSPLELLLSEVLLRESGASLEAALLLAATVARREPEH